MPQKLIAAFLLISLALTNTLSTLPALSAPQTEYLMQGRVFEGTLGDESQPLAGVTVSVYGSNAPYPESGTMLDTITTNSEGWYGLTVYDDDELLYDYIYIEEMDPSGYQSVEATTVDGNVRSANRIDFAVPLAGQDTSGNKFWDEIPVLSGRVYQGTVGDESTVLAGVEMQLFASNNAGLQGALIYTATTNSSGWYGLQAPLGYEYYTIVEVNPAGYDSEGSTSVDGFVLDDDRIQYAHPLAGQTLTGNKFWDTRTAGDLPDLVITEVWSEGGNLCYQVANIGTAPAAPGYETALIIDNAGVEAQIVSVSLGPGQTYENCFVNLWFCSAPEDTIEVVTDAAGVVAERNEDNNTWIDTWPCDLIPPEIDDGPYAMDITPGSALIYWETSEPASSYIAYGAPSSTFTDEVHDGALVPIHELLLQDLAPYTTYHYIVASTDGSGNSVESRVHSFRTAAEEDLIDPEVTFPDPGEITGTVTITATATDNRGVDRVQFLMDSKVIFTDYSPPYVLVLDTRAYVNGEHNLLTRAFDRAGNELTNGFTVDVNNLVDQTAPVVNITSPGNGAILSGEVNITASLSDDVGLAQVFFKVIQGTNMWNWGFEGLPANPTSYNASFEWDTTQVANGNYRVAIETFDMEGKYGYDYRDITVNQASAPKPAKLKVVGHSATRSNNGFLITLSVKNIGDETASNIAIEDTLKAFQPISRTDLTASYMTAYDPYYQQAEIQISAVNSIPGGQTATFTYAAVPVLFYPTSPTPAIGNTIYLHWDPPAGSREHDIVSVPIPVVDSDSLVSAHAQAVKTADYIIMTNPSRLYAFGYPDIEGAYSVLSEMGQLALYQQGVLGFLNTYDRGKIDALLVPTGAWAQKLSTQFSTALGGYVLIVGEREIVPTTFWGGFNLSWSNSQCVTTQVQDSDLAYANTSGDNAPELIVGRAIGNNPQDLYNVLHTSNAVYEGQSGYDFDRSHALLVSGTDGNTSIQDKFTGFINDLDKIITSDYAVTKIHWSTYTSSTVGVNAFTSATGGKDLVVYQGHGSPDGWGWFSTGWFDGSNNPALNVAPVDFTGANPLVMGLACLTGAYENHTANTCKFNGGDDNIAEGFLDKGAGIYIGSTEVSAISVNVQAGKEFFQTQWADYATTIGKAFTALKRGHWGSGKYWHLWIIEYNLYGDPKYGALPSPSTAALKQTVAPPSPTIDLVIPDYTVTTLNGIDYVEIPGGSLLMEEGMPEVPTYIELIDYPAGYYIQDVVLTERSGLTSTFGLNLPVHEPLFAMDDTGIRSTYHSAENDWYPAETYAWHLLDNPDGSTTLVLTVYPFSYNGATTASRFYSNYSFGVEFAESNVQITELAVDKTEVNYEETLSATLAISTTGPSGNVAVSCVIKNASTGAVMAELLMDTLTDLEGQASYAPTWLADHVTQDSYMLVCDLRNEGGVILDKQEVMFNLGTTSGVIHDFTISTPEFLAGETITASLTFHNDGTVDLNGTLVVDVRDMSGNLVETLSQPFTGLEPAHTLVYNAVWHTPLNAAGAHYLTGYALYNSDVTSAEILTSTGWTRVYVPVVLRQ